MSVFLMQNNLMTIRIIEKPHMVTRHQSICIINPNKIMK